MQLGEWGGRGRRRRHTRSLSSASSSSMRAACCFRFGMGGCGEDKTSASGGVDGGGQDRCEAGCLIRGVPLLLLAAYVCPRMYLIVNNLSRHQSVLHVFPPRLQTTPYLSSPFGANACISTASTSSPDTNPALPCRPRLRGHSYRLPALRTRCDQHLRRCGAPDAPDTVRTPTHSALSSHPLVHCVFYLLSPSYRRLVPRNPLYLLLHPRSQADHTGGCPCHVLRPGTPPPLICAPN